MSTDDQVRAAVDEIRSRVSDTKQLYREVCILLFFRHGIAPTANKLYGYVGKGTMSTPATVLAEFWAELREKSRVRIERPDIPEGLREGAGELVSRIWELAQNDASLQFQEASRAAADEVSKANELAEDAEKRAAAALEQQKNMALAAERDAVYIIELRNQLAAEREANARAGERARIAEAERDRAIAAMESARREFSADLERQIQSVRETEARFIALEKRALQDMDRQRQEARTARAEADLTRASMARAADKHLEQVSSLHSRIEELSKEVSRLTSLLDQAAKVQEGAQSRIDELESHLAKRRPAKASPARNTGSNK